MQQEELKEFEKTDGLGEKYIKEAIAELVKKGGLKPNRVKAKPLTKEDEDKALRELEDCYKQADSE